MAAALYVMQLSLLREANMKIQNNYPEPEELDTISLDELDEQQLEIEDWDERDFLEPDDGEELNFEDRQRGWR